MDNRITCFIPYTDKASLVSTIDSLKETGVVAKVYILTDKPHTGESPVPDTEVIEVSGLNSTDSVRKMAEVSISHFTLIYSKPFPLDPGKFSLHRMMQVCAETGAGMVYSGYYENKDGKLSARPLIDYQDGSLRDDFSFGSVLFYKTLSLKEACAEMHESYNYAGLYDLRLRVSQKHKLIYIPELLYTEVETDIRKSGEKLFDYVDPRNRNVQIEMESACNHHLKRIGAWLKPDFEEVNPEEGEFEYEASVIIPVRNRVKTIADAIKSVLSQEAAFRFNILVIDNYSDDGTGEIIENFASRDSRVIHIIPERKDLGIGGCWNEGLFHEKCGRFAIQLDSDDLYIDNSVLSQIVKVFYEERCAMVVGSYKMVNFQLQDIPPGLIDHKEWTPDNGRNNALRINGLGAPRAFFTPLLRTIRIPNVSYGEDYAVGLAISRQYRIGRIYNPLYLCRRWDDNSDASLDVNKTNLHNLYKDKIRTIELLSRILMNKKRTYV